jgi:hypothetical protein
MKAFIAALLLIISSSSVAMDNVVPNKLIQLILDSEELEPYWHVDIKGRVPLNILHKYVGTSTGISKFGKNIILIKSPNELPYFEINNFSIKSGLWHVRVSYSVEGIIGKFTAKQLPNGMWQLMSAKVVEK